LLIVFNAKNAGVLLKNPSTEASNGAKSNGLPKSHNRDQCADLTRDSIQELRVWPGCETVQGIAVLATGSGKFTVHVVDYGFAKKNLADRALRCIQREKQRRYHLKVD
jgi:hypothetical protein